MIGGLFITSYSLTTFYSGRQDPLRRRLSPCLPGEWVPWWLVAISASASFRRREIPTNDHYYQLGYLSSFPHYFPSLLAGLQFSPFSFPVAKSSPVTSPIEDKGWIIKIRLCTRHLVYLPMSSEPLNIDWAFSIFSIDSSTSARLGTRERNQKRKRKKKRKKKENRLPSNSFDQPSVIGQNP